MVVGYTDLPSLDLLWQLNLIGHFKDFLQRVAKWWMSLMTEINSENQWVLFTKTGSLKKNCLEQGRVCETPPVGLFTFWKFCSSLRMEKKEKTTEQDKRHKSCHLWTSCSQVQRDRLSWCAYVCKTQGSYYANTHILRKTHTHTGIPEPSHHLRHRGLVGMNRLRRNTTSRTHFLCTFQRHYLLPSSGVDKLVARGSQLF